MRRSSILSLVIASLFFTGTSYADTTSVNNKFSQFRLEGQLGYTSFANNRLNQDFTINVGYRNLILSARSMRADNQVFANAWMLGYRTYPAQRLNFTFSAGITDMAFRSRNFPGTDVNPENYRKALGGCGQVEAALQLAIGQKVLPLSFTGSIAYHYTTQRDFVAASIGLRVQVLPWNPHTPARRIGKDLKDTRSKRLSLELTVPKNLLRTKFIFGIWSSTFIEYERALGDKVAVSVGYGIKYGTTLLGLIFMSPDAPLNGHEVNAGVNFRSETRRGWWSFGVKAAYRDRKKDHYWAYYGSFGDDYQLSRTSKDYIAMGRISYSHQHNQHLIFEWYTAAGIRWSDQVTTVHGFFPTYQSWLNRTPYVVKESVQLPIVNVGMNIGIGW